MIITVILFYTPPASRRREELSVIFKRLAYRSRWCYLPYLFRLAVDSPLKPAIRLLYLFIHFLFSSLCLNLSAPILEKEIGADNAWRNARAEEIPVDFLKITCSREAICCDFENALERVVPGKAGGVRSTA